MWAYRRYTTPEEIQQRHSKYGKIKILKNLIFSLSVYRENLLKNENIDKKKITTRFWV